MNINEVFFWFCKEQKIMDIIIKMYYHRKIGRWIYDRNNGLFFKALSFNEFLEERIKNFGFYDIFWTIQTFNSPLIYDERYKKARSKWNKFCKNNVIFSDNFIKIGDEIEIIIYGSEHKGTVIEMPKNFSGEIKIKTNDERIEDVNVLNNKIKINGVERKPEFYIKRKRKIYGANKR